MTAAGRVALVTGAARGIGAATVNLLCARGYRVIAVDICAAEGPGRPAAISYPLATEQELASVAARNGDAVIPVQADVRDPVQLRAAVDAGLARFGRLDAVVAAAAVIAGGKPLWESPDDELQAMWDVDVRGVWNTASVCVPPMLQGTDPGGCRFIAVASAAGERGLFHLAAYNTAKHAVIGLVRGLAADLVGTGMTAVAVSPGSTNTPMLEATADLYGLASPAEFAQHQNLRQLLEPEEVAEVIAFCCSAAGRTLNGSVVAADGGFGA